MKKLAISLGFVLILLTSGCDRHESIPTSTRSDYEATISDTTIAARRDGHGLPLSEAQIQVDWQFVAPAVGFYNTYPSGSVNVLSYYLDTVANSLTIMFAFDGIQGDASVRSLVLSGMNVPNLALGLRADLMNEQGMLLWRSEIEADTGLPVRVRYVEITDADTLTLDIAQLGDTTVEKYRLGEDEFLFKYLPWEYYALADAARIPHEAFAKSVETMPMSTVGALYSNFLRLEGRARDASSLFGNVNGELMFSMLADDQFLLWLKAEVEPQPDTRDGVDLDELCGYAGAVTGVKCLLTGPENPVCIIGTGVTLACHATRIVIKIWSWFNDSLYD